MLKDSNFPQSFQQYRPRWHKVFGIICSTKDEKYLLVQGMRTGKWSFPKGHMEGKESALECALRELWEETGVRLSDRIYHGTLKLSRNKQIKNSEYFVYTVDEAIPVSIQDSKEIMNAGWFTIEQMRTMHCNMDVTHFRMRDGKYSM